MMLGFAPEFLQVVRTGGANLKPSGRTLSDLINDAFDLIDEFDRLNDPGMIGSRLAFLFRSFGYTSFLIGETVIPPAKPVILVDGWPEQWRKYYAENDCFEHDPMANWCRVAQNPFEWETVPKSLMTTKKSQDLLRVASDLRRHSGFVVPIIRTNAPVGAVTLCSERRVTDNRVKRAVHLVSLYAYMRVATLLNPGSDPLRDPLSKGERDALSWIGAGKTTWEISVILHISEATVDARVRRAMKKLDAVNRTHAVVSAIKSKQIAV